MMIITNIDKHIEMCKKSLEDKNEEKVFKEILGIYEREISGGTGGFLSYSYSLSTASSCDYTAEIKLLIEKLELYKSKLLDEEQQQKDELERLRLQAEISRNNVFINNNNTNNNENNLSSTITITLNQTISAIKQIPSDVLSDEDKEKLQNDIYILEGIKTSKNKSKFWDKAKDVMKFLADKGANAAIAAMPYIIQTLSQM